MLETSHNKDSRRVQASIGFVQFESANLPSLKAKNLITFLTDKLLPDRIFVLVLQRPGLDASFLSKMPIFCSHDLSLLTEKLVPPVDCIFYPQPWWSVSGPVGRAIRHRSKGKVGELIADA